MIKYRCKKVVLYGVTYWVYCLDPKSKYLKGDGSLGLYDNDERIATLILDGDPVSFISNNELTGVVELSISSSEGDWDIRCEREGYLEDKED